MKKLYVVLATPVVELKITAKDAAGVHSTLTCGFKRKSQKEANIISEKMVEFSLDILNRAEGKPLGTSVDDLETASLPSVTYTPQQKEDGDLALTNLIKDNIEYVLKADCYTMEEGSTLTKYTVKDTRTALPLEGSWETPEECLEVLLSMYFDCIPWRAAFTKALHSALLNTHLEQEASTKN